MCIRDSCRGCWSRRCRCRSCWEQWQSWRKPNQSSKLFSKIDSWCFPPFIDTWKADKKHSQSFRYSCKMSTYFWNNTSQFFHISYLNPAGLSMLHFDILCLFATISRQNFALLCRTSHKIQSFTAEKRRMRFSVRCSEIFLRLQNLSQDSFSACPPGNFSIFRLILAERGLPCVKIPSKRILWQ